MPIMLRNGKILMRDGAVAMGPDCCCGPLPPCSECTLDPPRPLYLSVRLTTDLSGCAGIENCFNDGVCEFCGMDGFDDLPTWPDAAAVSSLGGAVFLSTPGENPCEFDTGYGVQFLCTFYCIDDQFHIAPISSGPFMFIWNDDCDFFCTVRSALTGVWPNGAPGGDAHPIGFTDCDAVYVTARVPVTLHHGGTGEQCGTGTMHITITE